MARWSQGNEPARDVLARFADLERSPEHVHTYRLSALALWNAAALGVTADQVVDGLAAISRFAIPEHVEHEIRDLLTRHGVCRLVDGPDAGSLWLEVHDAPLRERIEREPKLGAVVRRVGERCAIAVVSRGLVKRGLLAIGYPVEDVAGLTDGAPVAIRARRDVFTPYPYQTAAVGAFVTAGHGVIVLPCGAGKTVVGLLVMEALATRTLVLTSSREAAAIRPNGRSFEFVLRAADLAELGSNLMTVQPAQVEATIDPVHARRPGPGVPEVTTWHSQNLLTRLQTAARSRATFVLDLGTSYQTLVVASVIKRGSTWMVLGDDVEQDTGVALPLESIIQIGEPGRSSSPMPAPGRRPWHPAEGESVPGAAYRSCCRTLPA